MSNQAGESEEYERFKELTRRLAQVPKEEVDELEREDATRTSTQRKDAEEGPDDASGAGSAGEHPS